MHHKTHLWHVESQCDGTLHELHRDIKIIMRMLRHLSCEVAKMAMSFTALEAQVAKQIEVETSAIVLIQGIADALKNAAGDPAKVEAIRVQLEASATALAAAVVANTLPTQ